MAEYVAMDASGHAKAVVEEMDPIGSIEGLDEWVRWRVRLLLCGLALVGYGRAKVICGYRCQEACEQDYGKGRTAEECEAAGVPPECALPGWKRVTWIVPKYNMHWRHRAVDVDLRMYTDLAEDMVNHIARTVGMTWGGVWSVRDTYHFEI